MLKSQKEIVVIGGGIVGLATAYKLCQSQHYNKVTVLEKEDVLGSHQTGNNSGVLHAGLYYKPGSSKAKLAVRGIQQMIGFCEDNEIPHEICGKLVIACDDRELARLHNLFERGQQNGLLGLKQLNQEQLREIEPHAAGIAAIHVPQEGIVDYRKVVDTISSKLQNNGGNVVTSAKVTKLRQLNNKWIISTLNGVFEADIIINCAGLYCDRISELAGEKRETRIIPFRGEYYKIKTDRQFLVKNLIYPVPDPQFPFLGVHFTRLIHGGIEAGPNAVLALAREGYRKSQINLGELYDIFSYDGFWRFLQKHWSMSLEELFRSFSKKLFCQSLQKLVPEIQEGDLEVGGAGVRAQAIFSNGDLVQDFNLVYGNNALHVLNAPSPAATASLAIGEEIAAYVTKYF
ncbi:L-2-hydroxyglutarate oxidase [Pseudanabaena sp. UWO310]|uniref:L-2-hydroxyglutarate oxidase n=1 Tax=Pseudanabaena sp. UWO310 TaxID=2480795 RepID=UPI00115B9706|nr:L-2-hydroxyglutarate oxidase [Pseudanabaena sp. UWO310]TYQ27676.1 L-2-hydroxyglutarate oxidase [Pseudanabaena sp. UWO310]